MVSQNIPINMKFYRYTVDSLILLIPDDPTPINIDPTQITDIALERDYDNDYFPILRLSVTLHPKIYFKILKNKLGIKIKFRMQKYIYDNNKKFQFKKDVFNDVFTVYLDENTPFIDESSYDQKKEVERTSTTPKDLNNEFTFYLYRESDLANSKKIINKIVSGANLTDITTYCFSFTGCSRVLMTPFDNKKIYNEVILAPLTLLGHLITLEQTYGFYNNGALIFFDIDCIYVIDQNIKCTAFRTGEYKQTLFTIRNTTNSDVFTPGSLVDDINKKYIISVLPTDIQMYNTSVVSDQIDGNNLLIINPGTGIATQINTGSTQRGAGTYKVMVNKNNNTFMNSVAKLRRNENSQLISATIGDFDIDALTPNKEFLFMFEKQELNVKHGGSYRISRVFTTFAKQGKEFTISSLCEFKKYNIIG